MSGMASQFEQHTSVANPIAKTTLAVGGASGAKAIETVEQAGNLFGIMSWADLAAALAAGYTLCLWGHWAWKAMIRPFCEQRGWMKRSKRRRDDTLQD